MSTAREKVADAIFEAEPSGYLRMADAAIAAHLEALRPWLVELQDIARKQMLASHPDAARYFAGRVDGIRDVLEHLK